MVTSLAPIEILAALVGVAGTVSGVVVALCWRKIGNWHKKRAFEKLILRELEEFRPYPDPCKVQLKKWTQYLGNKQFIHQEILKKPNGNLEFVLSLDADLVYCVSQLWFEVAKPQESMDHFMSLWKEIKDYCDGRKINRPELQRAYEQWEQVAQLVKQSAHG